MYKIKIKGKEVNPNCTFFTDEDGYLCYHYDEGIDYCHDDYRIVRKSGVKDKNGVEICDGDIVMYPKFDHKNFSNIQHSVMFIKGCFILRLEEDGVTQYDLIFYFLKFPEELEVIN